MVCDVCEVQMQLGYEEKKLIVTSPKETWTGWLQGHQEYMIGLQYLGENYFHLKEMKADEENTQRKKQCWRERQWLIILPITTAVDFIKLKTTKSSIMA